MKKTVITTFAAVAALSAGLVAAKGAHEPSWHTQDHGEIPGLQAVPKDNAERAEKSDDSVKFAYTGDTDGAAYNLYPTDNFRARYADIR